MGFIACGVGERRGDPGEPQPAGMPRTEDTECLSWTRGGWGGLSLRGNCFHIFSAEPGKTIRGILFDAARFSGGGALRRSWTPATVMARKEIGPKLRTAEH